jgi:hypothetical protein
MKAIESEENIPNVRTLAAMNKRIIGALVSSSHTDDLVEVARRKNVWLFSRDGSGFVERTSLSFKL